MRIWHDIRTALFDCEVDVRIGTRIFRAENAQGCAPVVGDGAEWNCREAVASAIPQNAMLRRSQLISNSALSLVRLPRATTGLSTQI